MSFAKDPLIYRTLYGDVANANPLWGTISGATGQVYDWPTSTYIAKPPFFDGFKMATGQHRRHQGRARARHLRRFGHHRPHQPGGLDQADVAGGRLPAGERRVGRRLQQLRLAPRQPRRDDARHVRQRADQEPDAAAEGRRRPRGRRRHALPAVRREDADLRRGDEVHRGRHADDHLRRRGIRHRDRRATGRRRARSSSASRRSSRRASSASTARTSSAWACCPASSRAATRVASLGIKGDETFDVTGIEAGIKPQMDVTLDDPPQGRHDAERAGAAAHRHADRGRLLPERRHPAVRAARADGDGSVAQRSRVIVAGRRSHRQSARRQALPGFIPQAPARACLRSRDVGRRLRLRDPTALAMRRGSRGAVAGRLGYEARRPAHARTPRANRCRMRSATEI